MRLIVVALALALTSPAWAKTPRSAAAISDFKRHNPCPANGQRFGRCPGYVIDHVKPLACGGPDAPSNMQWQTAVDAREKDRWERRGCHR